MIEVEISSIRLSLMSPYRIVVLKDIHADRFLPIFIGQFEAEAINTELQDARPHPRPMTHDLIKSVIAEMGGRVSYILVNDLRGEIFYARIVVERDNRKIEIDARTSDAIAIAVRAKAPIFVNESVMNQAALIPEEDVDVLEDDNDYRPISKSFRSPEPPEEESVDESKLSAFADFLNTLDLDKLDDDKN